MIMIVMLTTMMEAVTTMMIERFVDERQWTSSDYIRSTSCKGWILVF